MEIHGEILRKSGVKSTMICRSLPYLISQKYPDSPLKLIHLVMMPMLMTVMMMTMIRDDDDDNDNDNDNDDDDDDDNDQR